MKYKDTLTIIALAIWKITKLFFTVLFVVLFANYAKKEVKEWWSK
jgi:hypothetical protein